MAITETEIRKIAELARLHVGDAEAATFAEQIANILGHVEVLSRVQPEAGVAPRLYGREAMPLREDTVDPPPMRVSAEGLAPAARDGFILVPRLATHGTTDESGDSADEGA